MKKYYFLLISLLISTPALADIEAIINKAVVMKEITQQEARDIYTFKERFGKAGNRPVLFRYPQGNKQHHDFIRDVLNINEEAFESAWKKNVNAGLEGKYQVVPNQGEMLDRVALTMFGVGYLDKDYLAISIGKSGVNIIRILP